MARASLLALCHAVLALSLCYAAVSAAAEVTIRFAHGSGPGHSWIHAAQRFAEEVGKASDGKIEVRLHDSDQMDSPDERIQSLHSGTLDMAAVRTRDMAGFAPSMQIFDLPYLLPNYRTAYKVLDGEIGQRIGSVLEQKGIRNLAFWEDDFRQIGNSLRPVTSVEEMEGLRISVPNTPIFVRWLRGLDAVPMSIQPPALYSALQRREVDGQDLGIFATYAAKYYEVQSYYTLTNHVYMPVALMINERFYQSLSSPQRRIIQTAAAHARDEQRRLNAELRVARLAEMKRAGLKVTELSPQAIARFRHNARESYAAAEAVMDGQIVQEILALE